MGKNVITQLTNLLNDMNELLVDIESGKFDKQIYEEAALEIYENLDTIFETCIEKYYSEYTPTFYKRTGSLYEVYDLVLNGSKIKWKFSPAFMPPGVHRADDAYIYQKMFVEGYHGGADDGPGHPRPGTPWYRTPTPLFAYNGEKPWNRWSDNEGAHKSFFSPYKRIDMEIGNYVGGKSKIIGRGINDILSDAEKIVCWRYSFFNNYGGVKR